MSTVGATPSPTGRAGGSAPRISTMMRFRGGAETWLALGVVVIIGLLIVPLPPPVLDGLLALSLALSINVLLVTLGASDPLEFSAFPSLLLLLTLLRLGLNVGTTRLILGGGYAGEVIDAFGYFLIGGNLVV
ncbi:MAG: FHIPEP family type III secretion protein, partial [Gemmatimonadales bacterium]|nr:FHIPEP family type III secretion protein [Gemmatimonadales bacterium]